jgi:hypothetical protein
VAARVGHRAVKFARLWPNKCRAAEWAPVCLRFFTAGARRRIARCVVESGRRLWRASKAARESRDDALTKDDGRPKRAHGVRSRSGRCQTAGPTGKVRFAANDTTVNLVASGPAGQPATAAESETDSESDAETNELECRLQSAPPSQSAGPVLAGRYETALVDERERARQPASLAFVSISGFQLE